MLLNQPFTLLLEGPIDNGDGHNRNHLKRLDCGCIIIDAGDGHRLLVKTVDDLASRQPIADEQDLPAIQRILEAAKLADWCERHAAVFTDCRVINTGDPNDYPEPLMTEPPDEPLAGAT